MLAIYFVIGSHISDLTLNFRRCSGMSAKGHASDYADHIGRSLSGNWAIWSSAIFETPLPSRSC